MLELFQHGDAEFVAALRRTHDPLTLGSFAAKWIADPRPVARQFLLDYLDEPLNCYRHEAMVKRLFKLAEAANLDDVMGAFLVALDRDTRRFGPGKMPRPAYDMKREIYLTDKQRAKYEKRYVLFSVRTRLYLRRRAWRYFRRIGVKDPERYFRAVLALLPRYTDETTADFKRIAETWGLAQILYRHSPALKLERPWYVLGPVAFDEAPYPRFPQVWENNPDAIFTLLLTAKSRWIRDAMLTLLRRHHAAWLEESPITRRLMLIDAGQTELGFELLEQATDFEAVPVDVWLRMLDGDNLDTLTRLAELLTKRLDPARMPDAAALKLAAHRSRPVAMLGYAIVRKKEWGSLDLVRLLANAECEAVRNAMVQWILDTQYKWPREWDAEELIELFDSRFIDVRQLPGELEAKWAPGTWATLMPKLSETPYQDVRLWILSRLQIMTHTQQGRLAQLWLNVLTNIHSGGRQKPGVVQTIVTSAAASEDPDALMPLLAVAVRSSRGPEFRAGLAGLVKLAAVSTKHRDRVRERFPELSWEE